MNSASRTSPEARSKAAATSSSPITTSAHASRAGRRRTIAARSRWRRFAGRQRGQPTAAVGRDDDSTPPQSREQLRQGGGRAAELLPAVDADERSGSAAEESSQDDGQIPGGMNSEAGDPLPSSLGRIRKPEQKRCLAAAMPAANGRAAAEAGQIVEQSPGLERVSVAVEGLDPPRGCVTRRKWIAHEPLDGGTTVRWRVHESRSSGALAGRMPPRSNTCSETKSLVSMKKIRTRTHQRTFTITPS